MLAMPPTPMSSIRRILCLDGGGIMGALPASLLASLEEDLERPLGEYFDLIAGTSTGGILAIGLGLGLSAKQLLQLYVDRGPHIFGDGEAGLPPQLSRARLWLKHWFAPKHDAKALRQELETIMRSKAPWGFAHAVVDPSVGSCAS